MTETELREMFGALDLELVPTRFEPGSARRSAVRRRRVRLVSATGSALLVLGVVALGVGIGTLGDGGGDRVSPSGQAPSPSPSLTTRQQLVDLSAPLIETGQGNATFDLGAVPEAATVIRVRFACLTGGQFAVDPEGGTVSCDEKDARRQTELDRTGRLYQSEHQVPLAATSSTFTIRTSPGARWRLSATYAREETTRVPLKAQPDLIPAVGDDEVEGYVRWSDLNEPVGPALSPEQGARRTRERVDENGDIYVALYSEDGRTVIGRMKIGRVG